MYKVSFYFSILFITSLFYSNFLTTKEKKWGETEIIWNFGIAQNADVGLHPNPYFYFSHREFFYKKPFIYLQKNQIAWINPEMIPSFYKYISRVQHPFILIVSDGDNSFPYECGLNKAEMDDLIANKKIIHIFAQNLDLKHPKLSPIPIGIDFHSRAFKKDFDLKNVRLSPKEQEKTLLDIVKTLKPTNLRKKKIFVDFQLYDTMRLGGFKRYLQCGEDRTSIFNQILMTNLVDYIPYNIPRSTLWKTKGDYAFSVSPHGNGLDCHRTWEDLVLGCIVIVKTSPLDPLYEGLPIVIVNDWSEITEKNLELWVEKFKDAFTNSNYREKLTNNYWFNKIKEKKLQNETD